MTDKDVKKEKEKKNQQREQAIPMLFKVNDSDQEIDSSGESSVQIFLRRSYI